MFVFDGVSKTITIEDSAVVNGAVNFTPEELWTEYVDWAAEGDNLKYSRALEVTGGNEIGDGEAIGIYLFIRNDIGWVIVPPSVDGVTVSVTGSVFGSDTSANIVSHIDGQATNIMVNRSSISSTRLVSVGSGLSDAEHDVLMALAGSGLTGEQIAAAVWAKELG